jgi:Hypoxia induced protein conserved region.
MDDALFYAAMIACFVVLGIVAIGFGTFAKGGETSRKWSNKVMQLRVAAQFVAVILIVIFAWAASG